MHCHKIQTRMPNVSPIASVEVSEILIEIFQDIHTGEVK